MNVRLSAQRNLTAHNVVPLAHQERLVMAAERHDMDEIDAITDELVVLGLARPRSAASQLLACRVGKAAPDVGGRVL